MVEDSGSYKGQRLVSSASRNIAQWCKNAGNDLCGFKTVDGVVIGQRRSRLEEEGMTVNGG